MKTSINNPEEYDLVILGSGTGRFVGPGTIEVDLNDGGTRTFRGRNVVINTGSRATMEPIPGLADVKPLTHIEALELDQIRKHLLVLV